MRFRAELRNIRTFNKLTAALNTLEKIAWVRLDDETCRFTVIPDTGSQVWASLSMDLIFDEIQLESNQPDNTINLELPIGPLQRALKSAINSDSASLRLTKKNGVPVLSMTIYTTPEPSKSGFPSGFRHQNHNNHQQHQHQKGGYGGTNDNDPFGPGGAEDFFDPEPLELEMNREREKVITQDIPIRILAPDSVETIMQPKIREPDVHVELPPLLQLKAISDRFTKIAVLAGSSSSSSSGGTYNNYNGGGNGMGYASGGGSSSSNPKLEISANMHGTLKLRIATDALQLETSWTYLSNPELESSQLNVPLAEHPSTKFREAGPEKYATVRVDGRDWSRVLSVGRLEGRVIACFVDGHALILYVYVPRGDGGSSEESVVTYYVSSYSS